MRPRGQRDTINAAVLRLHGSQPAGVLRGFQKDRSYTRRVIRRVLVVVVLVGLIPAVGADAHHSGGFLFEGAGSGHRVGMGQWGAYGQALANPDKPGEQIAAYYFPGSTAGLSGRADHASQRPAADAGQPALGQPPFGGHFAGVHGRGRSAGSVPGRETAPVPARSRSVRRQVRRGSSVASLSASVVSSTAANSRGRRATAGRPSPGPRRRGSGSVTVRTGACCAPPGPARGASTGTGN